MSVLYYDLIHQESNRELYVVLYVVRTGLQAVVYLYSEADCPSRFVMKLQQNACVSVDAVDGCLELFDKT